MRWVHEQIRCVRRFSWHPIGAGEESREYRWLQTVYIRQELLGTVFCIPLYENKEFISKEEYEHYVKFGW